MRLLRALAVLVFAATAFLPVHGCGPGPTSNVRAMRPAPPKPVAPDPVQVPIDEIVDRGARGWRESGPIGAIWKVRIWYPYLLVPLWLGALLLAATGPRLARAAGRLLISVSLAIAVFELAYISYQFNGFLSPFWRPLEVGVAWILVLAILFVRRSGRSLLDPEATVSAHAFLAVCHGLTYPVSDARSWLRAGHAAEPVLQAIFANYFPAFWVALGALVVAAVPGYAFRTRPLPLPEPLPAPEFVAER